MSSEEKSWRERLTPRIILSIIGSLMGLFLGLLWLRDKPLVIAGQSYKSDAAIFILTALGGLLPQIISMFFPKLLDTPIFKPSTPARQAVISDSTRQINRTRLINLMQETWIDGYLKHLLNEQQSLKLGLAFAQANKVLQKPGMDDYTLPDSTAIYKVFEDLNYRLVILGEKGTGKTVTLLQLMEKLIEAAKQDKIKPVPVMLPLASWVGEKQPFEDWVRQEMRTRYGLPTLIVDDLVKGEQLVFLLDGLDEIAKNHRRDCSLAMKTFFEGERPTLSHVICSRRREWVEIPEIARLTIIGEIVIQALTPNQIDEYLSDPDFKGLRAILRTNSIVRDFAKIPFMLNTMAYVTKGLNEGQIERRIENLNSEKVFQEYFLQQYVDLRLKAHPSKHYSDLSLTRRYLKWLAHQLVAHNQIDFFIEDLQPDWLGSVALRELYRQRLYQGLSAVLLIIVVVTMLMTMDIKISLLIFLPIMLLDKGNKRVLDSLFEEKITFPDHLRWKWSIDIEYISFVLSNLSKTNMKPILILSGIFGLVLGVINRDPTTILIGALVSMIAIALLYFVIITSVSLFIGIVNGFRTQELVERRVRPAQGLRNASKNATIYSLTNIILLLIIFIFIVNIVFGRTIDSFVSSARWAGIWLGIIIGGMLSLRNSKGWLPIIEHMILRFILINNGVMPLWRYDRFLDYASECVIMRQAGAGYRFVHDYLREYLASEQFVVEIDGEMSS